DGDADRAHLREVRPLAAEQVFHVGATIGLAAAKGVNILGRGGHRTLRLLKRVMKPAGWSLAPIAQLPASGNVCNRNCLLSLNLTGATRPVKGLGGQPLRLGEENRRSCVQRTRFPPVRDGLGSAEVKDERRRPAE